MLKPVQCDENTDRLLAGCSIFSLGPSSYDGESIPDLSSTLPALCTNSAPLTRSNVTSYDTTRQIDVSTPTAGILRGFRDKFTWRFMGIKFAESPAGVNRFQPPIPLQVSPDTVRTALGYGPSCAQVNGLLSMIFYRLRPLQAPDADNGHILYTAEDCLQLNVYSPVATGGLNPITAPRLPVMFFSTWIHRRVCCSMLTVRLVHGGGLNTGDSGPFPFNMTTSGYVGPSMANVYDGTNLVSYGGVVLVTINYRLSGLGWFNASNAALKDALLALHWVQDNIEAFGGDVRGLPPLVYGLADITSLMSFSANQSAHLWRICWRDDD